MGFIATVATGRVLPLLPGFTQHLSLHGVQLYHLSTCTNTSARHDPAGFTQPTSLTPPERFGHRGVHESVHKSAHGSVHESVRRLILRWFNVLSLNGMNGTDGDGI